MQRLLALSTALLILTLLLSGCFILGNPGENGNSNTTGETIGIETQESDIPDSQSSEQVSNLVNEFSRGTITGNIYNNEFAALSFNATENWIYASDEEIAAIMGLGSELLNGSDSTILDEISKMSTIYDMMAQDSVTGSNVILFYENLSLTVGGTLLTEDVFLSITRDTLAEAEDSYTFGDIRMEEFLGASYKMLPVELPSMGIKQYYYARKINNYMLNLIVTTCGDDDITTILGKFSSLE